ncbi:MAG: glycosyl hydrolase [Saprospiraceae bacterium]
MKKTILTILFLTIMGNLLLFAQRKKKNKPVKEEKIESIFSGLKLRSVGPAFASGRIADIAVHPNNDNVWYVATGSGGVWKTKNSGHTWTPIFDDYPSYSTGCITLDPSNPSTIWLGTGENVGGRHVAYGDGIYKSTDGGQSWKNMGLKKSEHISEIIVHPENPNIIYVAAQGPLWKSGGERGLYKSIDGGATWKKVLGNSEWTGVTDIAMDPRDANVMYAATWDRHRTIAAFMGGGPGSGLHQSRDGGATWTKLKTGLPKSNLGKIGIAISPQQPDVIYAAIELDRKTGGVFRSTNQGASWKKMSNAVSGATGPHYYQELYASPHQFDRLYLMNVRILVSDNGGADFRTLTEEKKHSDNHAIVFRKDDPNYLLVGTDAGIYESFDLAANWRFIPNLPLTQYYKVAVDDREPFYHIFGGTQDNGSHGGPSRTDNRHGIRNQDWYKTLGSDGHQSATEPGNPNIIYAETQQGGMHRVDLKTGEQVFIQPQAGEGEGHERFNWDAPIVVSPHNPATLYFASHRVWRSDNRGDSWTAISGDLTRNEERITLPIMGKQQSWDNPWDVAAMSVFNSITSLSQSPLQEGLIYAGTDDGIIQVTEDGGENWRKIMVEQLPGVPARAFVNDIKADLHDVNTVYIALDNHKSGDFQPYLYKSNDKGKTWQSIKGNSKAGGIPDRVLTWRIVQDHIKKDLLFAATEHGIYVTLNGGQQWEKLKGAPTISFRDLAIQRRENDLVGASFGRSFYVLDDYSAMREVTEENLKAEATLFSTRKAWRYVPKNIAAVAGADGYAADNPDFGAVFTYHLSKDYKTKKATRKEKEKELTKEGKEIPFQGWEALEAERRQVKPTIWLTVKDASGDVIRKIKAPTKKGMNRTAWDLRFASTNPIRPGQSNRGGNRFRRGGALAPPGTYSVSLSKEVEGKVTNLAGPVAFEVVPLRKGTLDGVSPKEYVTFSKEASATQTLLSATSNTLNENMEKVDAMMTALERANIEPGELNKRLYDLKQQLFTLEEKLYGNQTKSEIGERNAPTINSRLRVVRRGLSTTYGPTPLHRESLVIAKNELKTISEQVEKVSMETIPALEKNLKKAGAPYIHGQPIPKRR